MMMARNFGLAEEGHSKQRDWQKHTIIHCCEYLKTVWPSGVTGIQVT